MGKREIRALTGMRGVAAIWVMIFHYYGSATRGGQVINVLFGQAYLAVDLFFVLSGYVIAMSCRDRFADGITLDGYRSFMLERFARIYPLYAVTLMVVIALAFAGLMPKFGVGQLLANVFLIQQWGISYSLNPPSWSISTELIAYLAFPFLAKIMQSRGNSIPYCLMLVSAATVVVVSLLYGSVPEAHSSGPALRCLSAFTLGMLSFHFLGTGRLRGWDRILVPLLIALAMVPRCDVAFILLAPFAIASIASGNGLVCRVLASSPIHRLGVISYSIYLIHWPAGTLRSIAPGHPWASVIAVIGFVILASWASHRLIEVPSRAMILGFGRRDALRAA